MRGNIEALFSSIVNIVRRRLSLISRNKTFRVPGSGLVRRTKFHLSIPNASGAIAEKLWGIERLEA